MGAGAGKTIPKEIKDASVDDMKQALAGISAEDRQKVLDAITAVDKTTLVTGVSGIGGEFAKIALANGHKVFVVDRKPEALSKLPDHGSLVKIEADVGTEEGLSKIKAELGSQPISYMFLAAAVAVNVDNKGHGSKTITRSQFDDMIGTDVYGKVFVVQAFMENLQASPTKARVFNVGAPFGDGPMPNGKFMAIPGWVAFGAAKSASRYVWEGMKVEMNDVALFGYGHPGMTKTSITEELLQYDADMMLSKMANGRFGKGDYMEPADPAKLFWAVFTKSSDEDFQGKTWNINTLCSTFPDVEVKQTSDVASGIKMPEPEAPAAKKEEQPAAELPPAVAAGA